MLHELIARFWPRCLLGAFPWCSATSIAEYCACLSLFYEGSLYSSPFGPPCVILNDCQSLLPYYSRCAEKGILTFASQPGCLNRSLGQHEKTTHVNQREYLYFAIWKSEDVDVSAFVQSLRAEGFSVTVEFEETEEIVLTEEKVTTIWRPFTIYGTFSFNKQRKKRMLENVLFADTPKELKDASFNSTVFVFVHDAVWVVKCSSANLRNLQSEHSRQSLQKIILSFTSYGPPRSI